MADDNTTLGKVRLITSDLALVTTANPLPGLAKAIRGTPISHRSSIAAVDKLASPTAVDALAKNDDVVGVMAASGHYAAIAAGNLYGTAGALPAVTWSYRSHHRTAFRGR